jgi:predicted DNA-binding protein
MTNKRQKSNNLVGFYLRIPADLKQQLEDLAKKRSCSKANIIVEMINKSINEPVETKKGQINSWLSRQ